MPKTKSDDWVRFQVPEEIRHLARQRILGYHEPVGFQTLEDMMVHCWIQGFLDGVAAHDQVMPLVEAEKDQG